MGPHKPVATPAALILAYHGISLSDEHSESSQYLSPEVFRARLSLIQKSVARFYLYRRRAPSLCRGAAGKIRSAYV